MTDTKLTDRAEKVLAEAGLYGQHPKLVEAIARALEEERNRAIAKEAEWLDFEDRDDLVNS